MLRSDESVTNIVLTCLVWTVNVSITPKADTNTIAIATVELSVSASVDV